MQNIDILLSEGEENKEETPAQKTMNEIISANENAENIWQALVGATQQDIAVSGNNEEWGQLEFESKVDIEYNRAIQGRVVRHMP